MTATTCPRVSHSVFHSYATVDGTVVFTTIRCAPGGTYCRDWLPQWVTMLLRNMPEVEPLIISVDLYTMRMVQSLGFDTLLHFLGWQGNTTDRYASTGHATPETLKWLYARAVVACRLRPFFMDADVLIRAEAPHLLNHYLATRVRPRLPIDVTILHDYYLLTHYWPRGPRNYSDDRAAWTRIADYFSRPLADRAAGERFGGM